MNLERPICRIMGGAYPKPLTLDEVPETRDTKGTRRPYFYVSVSCFGFKVLDAMDWNRNTTRECVVNGATHFDVDSAKAQMRALKAVLEHAIANANESGCVLCGVTFPAPIKLEDVPNTEDDEGSDKPYFYMNLGHNGFNVEEEVDCSRDTTRNMVSDCMVFWHQEDCEALIAAVQNAIRVMNSKAR